MSYLYKKVFKLAKGDIKKNLPEDCTRHLAKKGSAFDAMYKKAYREIAND